MVSIRLLFMNTNGRCRRTRAGILVVLILAIGFHGQRCYADDDTQKVVDAFKSFVPKFITALKAAGGSHAAVENVSYDVKKTDSAINPLIGVLSFTSSDTEQHISDGVYLKWSTSFSFTDGKWAVIEAKYCCPTVSGEDGTWTDDTPEIRSITVDAQK
jgi:hypothetical protein